MIIEGAIAVKAAILNKKRNINIIYIDKKNKNKDFNFIRKIIKLNNINYKELSKDEVNSFCVGNSSGGICADVDNRIEDKLNDGDIFYLDGIEDPFNLGYSIRSMYAFGINNLVLPTYDYSNKEAQILKSSAGAFEMINIIKCENIIDLIRQKKNEGYKVYALFRGEGSKDLFKENFNEKVFLIIGGEKRGIKKEVINECDDCLFIPYGSNFRNALNACSVVSILSSILYDRKNNK